MELNEQDEIARFQEIANRGLQRDLSPELQGRFVKGVRDGLITLGEDVAIDAVSPNRPTAKPQDSTLLNTGREFLQGLTLNTSDELGAAAAASLATLIDGADFKETYTDMLGLINDEQDAFREENPVLSIGAQLGGGLATGGASLYKLAGKTAGKHLAKRTAAASAVGAAEGSFAGYAGERDEDRPTGALVGGAVGSVLGAGGQLIGEGFKIFKNNSALKKEVAQMLKEGSTDKKVAKYILDGAGKAQKDPIAKQAIAQGVDEGTVAMIKGASRTDKANMRRMIAILERGKENAREGALNRASDVAGRSIVSRIRTLKEVNREAGRRIGEIAKTLKAPRAGAPGENLLPNPDAIPQPDFSRAINTFVEELDGIGVKLTQDPKTGRFVPDFTDSTIEDIPGAERLLKVIVKRLGRQNADALKAHEAKQFIRNHVSFGKSQEGLQGKVEGIAKTLARDLDQTLDATYPQYKKVNDVFAETRGVLDAIEDVAGSKIDITGRNADKALGTLSRSLLSNIRSRANMLNAFSDLDTVAKKYGNNLDDDIISQALFIDELDKMFGASARTSLQGDSEKAVRMGLGGGTREILTEAAVEGAKKVKGLSQENALKALKALLKDTPEEVGKNIVPK